MAVSCEIYLIRHGIAEERGEAWPDDGQRPLTEKGIIRLRKEMRGLARLGVQIDVVLTSPLVRALQTAEIVAASFTPRPPIVGVELLAPGSSLQNVIAELGKQGRRKRMAIVGHEPSIGELAARLTGSRQAIEFKKGAVCRIDVESLPPDAAGLLRWFITPRILRAIRK